MIVVLNGTSSSGKTTLARALQVALPGTWLFAGVDVALWLLPEDLFGDPAGISFVDGRVERGPEFLRVYDAYRRSVAALAASGVDVVVDDVLLDGGAGQARWDEALAGLDTLWVGVRCELAVLEERERARGDRPPGMARDQAGRVHEGVRYDLELDSGTTSRDAMVEAVADALGLAAGAAPERTQYVLGPLTADGSISRAPWESPPGPGGRSAAAPADR